MAWDLRVCYYLHTMGTLKSILKDIFYVLLKNNEVMKVKVHEEDREAAKTPLMIYYAK